jgi:hypothetical protein
MGVVSSIICLVFFFKLIFFLGSDYVFLFFNDLGVIFSFSDLNIFHRYNCFLLLIVLFFVFLGYIGLFILFFNQKLLLGYIWIEFLCSFFPVFLLLIQIFPSLFLL